MSDKLIIKIELNEADAKKFNFVKDHYNINRNAEVLRLAINDSYRIVQEREKIFAAMVGKKE